jgi:hypothetical protein
MSFIHILFDILSYIIYLLPFLSFHLIDELSHFIKECLFILYRYCVHANGFHRNCMFILFNEKRDKVFKLNNTCHTIRKEDMVIKMHFNP